MNDGQEATIPPVLTIAIPTWNRAVYLAKNLTQLRAELENIPAGLVEVLVSDNCSPDSTQAVVERAVGEGMPITYIRNDKNLGWALNFAQCYDAAKGKYVLLLGDDDLFVDGALALLLDRLHGKEYGVVCMRPYGFDTDFRQEHPGGIGQELIFVDAGRFLLKISRCFTLTSACVINKSLIPDVDSKQFIKTDLATFHLVLRAALAAPENLFLDKYLMASKRQNSFSYEYANVFVGQFWQIVDAHSVHGLSLRVIRLLEREKLLSYYPFYLLDLRMSGRGDLKATYEAFSKRFHGRGLFRYWLAPILRLPKPFGITWGVVTTVVGRVLNGDARRGLKFARSRVTRFFSRVQAS